MNDKEIEDCLYTLEESNGMGPVPLATEFENWMDILLNEDELDYICWYYTFTFSGVAVQNYHPNYNNFRSSRNFRKFSKSQKLR